MHIPWRFDGHSHGETCRNRQESGIMGFSESESWSCHEKEVTGKPVASRTSGNSQISKAGSRKWPHNFHRSPAVLPDMGKVYSIVRKIYGRSPTDDLNGLDVNTAVWSKFMNVTLQATVHLGRDFLENLRFTKNQLLKSVKQLFQVTEKLIEDQKEINNLTTIAKSLRGDRRVCYVTKLLRLRMPKPTSFSTPYYVWEVSVPNQSKPGRTKLNGIGKVAICKI